MAKKTNEKFIQESNYKFPHIEVLSEYKGSKEIMNFRCKIHDFVFSKTAHNFINSNCGCNLCAREKVCFSIKKSPEWFREELKLKNPNIEQISEYTTMLNKVEVKCKICGNVFESKAQDLLQGHSCRICSYKVGSQKRLKDNNWFLKEFSKYNPSCQTIEIIGKYSGTQNKIMCRCKNCLYKWETKASYLIDKRGGTGCPMCNSSKGELLVCNFLTEQGICFEQQKTFPNLFGVAGFPLLFDFYIPSKRMLVEINGVQHYEPIRHFGGTKKFNTQQEHDKRKRLYAQNNGYTLLEIEYKGSTSFRRIKDILQTNLHKSQGDFNEQ